MDKLTQYRIWIREILEEYHSYKPINPQPFVEDQLVIDEEHDHYLLLCAGWEGEERVYGNSLHLDIKDGKIWIQRDFIDVEGGIAAELMGRGVPKEDIVLAFHAPYKRPLTGFAVG
jgi:hypothetical protein